MEFRRKEAPIYPQAVLLLLTAALIVAIIVLCCVPPVSRDALSHHLAVPKLYLSHGGIYEIPQIMFSYYPMNIDLLYLLPLYFGNDIAAKFIHFSFALLSAWLIFHYLYKRMETSYALLGALLFLSLPLIVKLSISVYVDLGLIFFSTAALLYLLKWMETRFRPKYLIFSGCCCGLALGTKYNGMVAFVLLALFIPFIYARQTHIQKIQGEIATQTRGVGFAVVFAVAALLVFSPWMIRNFVWKQNPIYPLYHSWFSAQKASAPAAASNRTEQKGAGPPKTLSSKTSRRFSVFAYRHIIYEEPWWQTMLIPIRIFFSGKDDDPQYFDGKLNPFLLLLPLFAFIGLKEDRSGIGDDKWVLLAFSAFFILIAAFMVDMRIRYIAPVIPPLVILSVAGLRRVEHLIRECPRAFAAAWAPAVVAAVAAAMLLPNGLYVLQQFREVQPAGFISGKVSRAQYIEMRRGEYRVLQYANARLAPDAQILGVFLGNRIYYSDRKMMTDPGMLLRAVRGSDTSQGISDALKKMGLTHLIIRSDLFESWMGNNLEKKQRELIRKALGEQMKLLYFKNGYALFEL